MSKQRAIERTKVEQRHRDLEKEARTIRNLARSDKANANEGMDIDSFEKISSEDPLHCLDNKLSFTRHRKISSLEES